MNREIKFRGKRVANGEWAYGMLDQYQGKLFISKDSIEPPTFPEPAGSWDYSSYEVIPETVGQYTGVKDANDKEVFEGDKDESGYFIQYVDEYACFCYLDKDKAVAWQCVPTFFEQAGTIHD